MKWKLISVHFEIVLISTQDRSTICADGAIVSEVLLGAPDGTVGYTGLVEAHFSSFGDSVDLNAR